jgi:ribosomal protein S4
MNRDLQAKLEQQQQQQQQQQHDCGKHNLNFLRSYYKRKQKKQNEKTNTTKAILQALIRTAIFKLRWSSSRSSNTIAANLRT